VEAAGYSMDEAHTKGRLGSRWPSVGITSILTASACVFLGFRLVLALGGEDVDKYESPLMLSVARQLVNGPWDLYGPFGGSNPLVLIHAPLYYRAAALLAWPMARAGLHPVEAARRAGRLISMAGLLATAMAAYRLGRLGGLPARAGWWSALLVSASPVLSGQPFAVRPDMAGVALQTWAVVLLLESLGGPGRRLGAASSLFGLSACVKQHLVGAWAVSAALAWMRGRAGSGSVARVVLPGVAVAGAILGAEWLVTGGRIRESAFVAAANVGRVHPGDWLHVGTVIAAMAGQSAGLAALAVAGMAAARRGSGGWILATASMLVAVLAGLAVAQLAIPDPWITGLLPVVALVGLIIGLAGCVASVRSLGGVDRVDAALGLYLVIELLILVILCRSSSGAWINYGIQAIVFAAVLTARSLAIAVDAARGFRRALPTLAAVAVLASAFMDAKVEVSRRRAERADLARIFASTGLPPAAFFFADRPGLNRMSGRLEIVYDDWLYPAFESLKLAEPRGRWLRSMLASRSSVRAVVLESDSPRVDGIPDPLPTLGFVPAGRFGPFRVWTLGYPPPGAL
jgi:hypothetical protein